MKKLLVTAVVIILFASAFCGCNLYSHEEVEVIRCPQVQDSIHIPDWNDRSDKSTRF